MARKIIQINEEKCVGCGLCANACKQSAIQMVDGKAKVVRDDYCDGIGNCLPVCPVGAISFSDRDIINTSGEKHTEAPKTPARPMGGCPGSRSAMIQRPQVSQSASIAVSTPAQSALQQWPVQIKLVPEQAPYFENANLLIAADCSAYAYANFHAEFMKNKITIIGCPKLDAGDYTKKLTSIIANNNIKSVTVVRMEVPCCGGLEYAAKDALQASGKFIPWQIVTISTDGKILEN